MSILEYISDIPSNRVAFVSKYEEFSYKNLKELFVKNKKTIDNLKNSCIAINSVSRFEFAKLLCILDGNVKRIAFFSNNLDKNLLKKYYKQLHINYDVFLDNDIIQLNIIDENTDIELKEIKNTQWVIPTSGTTNQPKLVAHTFESLSRTTKTNTEIGSKYIWGLTFDIYRFSGIQVLLQSILGGSTIIIPESNYSMKDIINLFINNSCNIISATPSFWRKVLMTKESNNLKLRRATLGGEISDQSILEALKIKFKNIKITHIYASTEVGVGFVVTDGFAGFPYSYIKDGIENINMKISNDSVLFIKPKEKLQEYISNNSMYDDNGFIDTGDLVTIQNDRVLFLGRKSGSINVGGNKVQPEEVEIKLLASNLISNAFVYAKKSTIMGYLVCADVIPINNNLDKNELKKKLLSYCRKNLDGFKIPAIVNIVDDLEITQNGKLRRN
ncbi:acyl-CoA synthetase (AMP-forming)/AMP-acid ligase II [Campylobacter iguaniorum]|uniref:Long-chain-fatty-acid--CoA ligase n=1 Tax=Campylobacter iguaniorum TaxID=1244531 RepID=A0A076F8A5_9BACT|nr:class I adenylate-forming enzyme family protein [Campylobacter iguaniorum]AII13913.1 acyl-CoA synthetase (AMP-forming)/AMP-acid ligase II [Campylobacter iguaniorum]